MLPWTKASGRYISIRREVLGFLVLQFWLLLDLFFGFAVHFSLRTLRSLAFGFRFSSEIKMGFRFIMRFILACCAKFLISIDMIRSLSDL